MSEYESFIAQCERAVTELPEPFYGATPEDEADPQPGLPKITGWITTFEVHPERYQDFSDALVIGQALKTLAEKRGAEFRADHGVFFIRKPPPKK